MFRTIRDVIRNQKILTMPPTATVRDAARAMKERHVSSVMVTDGHRLIGIFTERDALFRVIAEGLDPENTALEAVMTKKVMTITPDRLLVHALHLMHDYGFRHMPVVKNGEPIGMVSVRDALGCELVQFEDEENVKQRLMEIMG
jgi:CBS domain-containing protein